MATLTNQAKDTATLTNAALSAASLSNSAKNTGSLANSARNLGSLVNDAKHRTFGSYTFDELNADSRTLDSIPETTMTFDTLYTPVINQTKS